MLKASHAGSNSCEAEKLLKSYAYSFGVFNGFGILPVFQGFCEAMVVEGEGLKSQGCGWWGGGGGSWPIQHIWNI